MTNNYDVINLVGIQNESVICYITTVIQILYSIKEIREYFLNTSFNKTNVNNNNIKIIIKKIFNIINSKLRINNKSYITKEEIMKFYKDLFLLIGERPTYNKATINHKIGNLYSNIDFSPKIHSIQGDVTEILRKILDILPDNIKSDFMINILDKTICEVGEKKINNKYKINNQGIHSNLDMLILNFPEQKILYKSYELTDLINFYTRKEKISLANCTGTGYKQIDIENTQKYLFITLIRSIYVTHTEQTYNTTPVNVMYNLKINKSNYKLIGMILKTGSANKGHFIYCTMKNNNPYKIYDNENVYTIINNKNKNKYNVKDVNGNNKTYKLSLEINSYVLLYTKIEKTEPNNIKMHLDIDILSELNNIILDRINILQKNIKP
jgi:ubiquitin C-terminal hydrolase